MAPAVGAPRSLTDVYGAGIAVCARPALEPAEPVGRNRHTRDVVSARPIAVAADTPVICSAGGTDRDLLARLRDGGLPVGTDLREFHTEPEFAVRVAEAMSDGLLISIPSGPNEDAAAEGEKRGIRVTGILVEPDGHAMGEVAALVDDGRLRVNVDSALPLADAARAHERLEAGGVRGKIVLTVK